MWIKVDDGFISHPKVLAAAERLGLYGLGRTLTGWLTGMSYAGRHLTDGAVPARIVRQIDDPKPQAVADALVAAGIWEPTADGYIIHDYHDYNPRAEKVVAARKAHLQRQQVYLAKRLDRQAAHNGNGNDSVNAAVNDALPNTRPNPVPIPSRPNHPTGEEEHVHVAGATALAVTKTHPDALMRTWNESVTRLPQATKMTPDRRRHCVSRLQEEPSLTIWRNVFVRLEASDFACGVAGGWRADFDFVLKPGTLMKVMEGKYDNRTPMMGAGKTAGNMAALQTFLRREKGTHGLD